jgi:hypothetical protein
MDIPIEELEAIGKQSFEDSFQAGGFFFPKVVWSYRGGGIEIGMYETEYENFVGLCEYIASHGPLDFLAHTADSYYFNAEADPETAKRIIAEETSASEQFEEGNPNASEALIVIVIDSEGRFDQRVLPYVRHGKTLEWSGPVTVPDSAQATGRYAETLAATIKASYDAKDENAGG